MQNKIRAYVVLVSNPLELVCSKRTIVSIDEPDLNNSLFIKVGQLYGIPIYQIDPERLLASLAEPKSPSACLTATNSHGRGNRPRPPAVPQL